MNDYLKAHLHVDFPQIVRHYPKQINWLIQNGSFLECVGVMILKELYQKINQSKIDDT